MGNTCLAVVGWLWRLSVNWDAVSAVGTLIAIVVALFLPLRQARREWARQDRLRQEDGASKRQRLVDARHEVCSAVDRVMAYREVAIALFDSAPVYTVGIDAIRRIQLNTKILVEVLDLLKGRPELSDGAVFSAVAGLKIGAAVIGETTLVLDNWGVNDPAWPARKAALEKLHHLAAIAQERSDAVRAYHGLFKSDSAGKIREKYLPLSVAIKGAIAAGSDAPENTVAESYY
jgi:hypothetical protein